MKSVFAPFAPFAFFSQKNIPVGCLEDYHERGQSKYILRKFETSKLSKLVRPFLIKKNDPLYIIQCSYQALRYTIVYVNENCQAAITFNNIARYLDFGRVTSKDYIFPWQSSGCSQYKCEWGILRNNSNQWVIQLSARKVNCLFVWPQYKEVNTKINMQLAAL